MQSLELLIITSFALVAIFAVVPVILQQIYYYQALVEMRSASAFFNLVADSLESDMGAAFAQRVINLPSLRFGSLKYSVAQMGICGGAAVFNTTFVYESQYLSAFGMLRGVNWGKVVYAPDTPIAVRGWGTSLSMAPRVVKYGDIAVVLNITYTAAQRASGVALYYNITAPVAYNAGDCALAGVDLSGVSKVLVVPVRLELR